MPKYVQVGEGLVLAAGGCGHAAKGADEIGETFLGAQFFHMIYLFVGIFMRKVLNSSLQRSSCFSFGSSWKVRIVTPRIRDSFCYCSATAAAA